MDLQRALASALCTLLLVSVGASAQTASAEEKIIVSGASGNLGGLVVQALLDRGIEPERLILVSRTPASLAAFEALGASTRFGDFTVPESLPTAYAGGSRMILISIGGGNLPAPRPELHRRAIDAAVTAGVQHIAYTSWIGISGGETDGLAADHLATENLLRDSGISWTMLRNSIYMDGIPRQAAQMIAAGNVEAPANEWPIAYVTRADCAAAAAAAVTSPGHENQIYDITGPELIGTREIAAAAAAASGRQITIRTGQAGSAAGLGSRSTSRVSTHVEQLIGRPPTSIEELLRAEL